MSTFISDSAMSAALSIIVKSSVLLGAAAIVQTVLYSRMSAATRHLVWMIAIVGILLLPALSLALPDWAVVIPTAAKSASAAPIANRVDDSISLPDSSGAVAISVESAPTAPHAANSSWSPTILSVYAAGVIAMLIQLAMQRRRVRRLAFSATEVGEPEWTRLLIECASIVGVGRPVRLLRSRGSAMPMAFGTRRPAILIPATADTWPDDRRRAVILHELAHVARYDCLTQTLALAACAMYWFHPAIWWVARRLRIERELACDDRVLLQQPPGACTGGQHGPAASARGSHARPARCGPKPPHSGLARADCRVGDRGRVAGCGG